MEEKEWKVSILSGVESTKRRPRNSFKESLIEQTEDNKTTYMFILNKYTNILLSWLFDS